MKEKYDRIGKGYDNTRKADPYLLDTMQHLLGLSAHGTYLDIGCGTGNYTVALANRGFQFIGVEPSERMLKVAQQRSESVTWQQGTAEDIPLAEESVEGVLGSLTIHHWGDISKGFQEIYRVLKPAGVFVLFTSTAEQMEGYWLNHYFPKMLADSILQMPEEGVIMAALESSGLKFKDKARYFVKDNLQDLFLYSGKNRPHLYLNETVRNGISSFSDLAVADEVKIGLEKLEADLQNGEWQKVIQDYKNEAGDYCFYTATK